MSICYESLEARRLLSAGAADTHFGNAGSIEHAPGNIVVMHDGRLLVVNGGSIRRYDVFGQFDPGFNVTLAPKARYSDATGNPAAVDSSDRLFVAVDGGVFCVLPTGRVDRSFGKLGVVPSPLTHRIADILVQSDGKVVLAGNQGKQTSQLDSNGHPFVAEAAAIARLNADGSIDTTFGTAGIVLRSAFTENFGDNLPNSTVLKVAQDHSGNLLSFHKDSNQVAMIDDDLTQTYTHLTRLLVNGAKDATMREAFFSSQAQFHFPTSQEFDLGSEPTDFTIDGQGRVVVALAAGDTERDDEFAQLRRLLPDGLPDASFGTNGVAPVTLDGSTPFDPELVLGQSNGQIVVSGNIDFDTAVIARFNSDGSLDQSFGDSGSIKLGEHRSVGQLALAMDGSILDTVTDAEFSTPEPRIITRRWRDESPAANTFARTVIAASPQSHAFLVTYRDDAAIDRSTLDNRDLRMTGPNGFVRYAKFDRVVNSTDDGDDSLLTARYKLAAPGGLWDAPDNGQYQIRLMDQQVTDTEGHATSARTIGRFVVNVQAAARSTVQGVTSAIHFDRSARDDSGGSSSGAAFDDLLALI